MKIHMLISKNLAMEESHEQYTHISIRYCNHTHIDVYRYATTHTHTSIYAHIQTHWHTYITQYIHTLRVGSLQVRQKPVKRIFTTNETKSNRQLQASILMDDWTHTYSSTHPYRHKHVHVYRCIHTHRYTFYVFLTWRRR